MLAPAELVQQIRQMRRQIGFDWAQILLQPFADSVANRPACLVVDEFVAAVDSAVHGQFRVA